MTAVARLKLNGHPVLIADLLTSSPPIPGSHVDLPSVEVRFGPEVVLENRPKGLCQKLAIVADNIVVGWAGRHCVAADVIGELKQRCEHEYYSSVQVADYFRRQSKSVWDDVQFTGFVLDINKSNLAEFACNCTTFQSTGFGEICVLGTGECLLGQYLKEYRDPPVCSQEPDNLAINAVMCGMQAVGNFLTMEQFKCESLDDGFGGGFEIATQSFARFVKLTDVLYAFWHATIEGRNASVSLSPFPFCVFRYEYYDDLLVVRGVGFQESDGGMKCESNVFPVPPVYRYLSPAEKQNPTIPNLEARWLCNFVQIVVEPTKLDILTKIGYSTDPAWLQFEEQNGRVEKLIVSEKFREEIVSGIINKYALLD